MRSSMIVSILSSVLLAGSGMALPAPAPAPQDDSQTTAATVAVANCNAPVKQIYEFPDSTFVENLHTLPDGRLLLSTFNPQGNLYAIDPNAANPSPIVLTQFGNGVTGLTGIATIGKNLYAISAGVHTSFQFTSMSVSVVSVLPGATTATVVKTIPVPNTNMMNGMAALPNKPTTILSVDSLGGRILRVDTNTNAVDVAFTDAALGPGGNTNVPLGANGLKIHNGYLYFANSGTGIFGRFPIDSNGNKIGNAQNVTSIGPGTFSNAFDDFDFDSRGNAYAAVHSWTVGKITPQGAYQTYAGSQATDQIKEPTSVAVANNGRSIYVSTGGTTVLGTVFGGQILQIPLL